jgi:hypothetical protein
MSAASKAFQVNRAKRENFSKALAGVAGNYIYEALSY